ncbi:MAG: DUF4097 family beta strand repeat protein [Clostridia bacterium]|nr:DUF4097 family beta strand repeat protein [Clostridia bacterium]
MTKEAYLNALRAALAGMSEQEKDAAVSFCEEALMDRMETGLTEEEAVAAMEDPAQMAEKLAVAIGRAPEKAKPVTGEKGTDSNEWQKMLLTCPANRLNHIDLEAGNLPIKVILAQDDQVRLTYYTRARNVYEAKVDGDTMTLREVAREKKNGIFNMIFNFELGTLPRVEIVLEVPQDLMADLRIKTRNAGISLKGPRMLTHVDLGTTNGGLAIEQLKCISLEGHTTNGGLTANDVETKKTISLHTTNGGVSASRCHAKEHLALKTTNGGIAAKDCTANCEMNIHTTNGGLAFSGLDAGAITLRTSNSRINGSVKGPQSQWKIDSHTTNGKNSLPGWQDGAKPLNVHTTNANIHVTFE